MDKQQLTEIAARFGTPSFVFDEAELAARMREVQSIVGRDVHLCYSIKANPFLIPAMRELVELLEVCSPGELTLCEDLGVDPDTILFSGVNKTAEDIAHAMDVGGDSLHRRIPAAYPAPQRGSLLARQGVSRAAAADGRLPIRHG